MKEKTIKKPKKKTDAQLKKILDGIFSQYIRLRYADDKGNVICSTCPTVCHWKEMQNGHYESRQYLSLRFEILNCHPQCMPCNVFKHGNYPEYTRFLIRKYGVEHLDWLAREKNRITKYFPYEERIEEYKAKVAELLKRL